MTVEQCTQGCKEIGQPIAALNSGTVSTSVVNHFYLVLLLTRLHSAHADRGGLVDPSSRLSPAETSAAAILPSDVAAGPVSRACTDPKWPQQQVHQLDTSDVGKRPRARKRSRDSVNGWTTRVLMGVDRSAQPRGTSWLVSPTASVSPD